MFDTISPSPIGAEDGTLLTFGGNEKGQLGHSSEDKFVPVGPIHDLRCVLVERVPVQKSVPLQESVPGADSSRCNIGPWVRPLLWPRLMSLSVDVSDIPSKSSIQAHNEPLNHNSSA